MRIASVPGFFSKKIVEWKDTAVEEILEMGFLHCFFLVSIDISCFLLYNMKN